MNVDRHAHRRGRSPAPTRTGRTGLRSLLLGQVAPRVSLRRPISMGLVPERAAEVHGRVPIYIDRPFDVDPARREALDYVQFAELVAQLSAALKQAGVKPWDRVAILKRPSLDIVTLAYAAARIGAIPALLSAGLDGEIVGVLLERLRCPFVFTDQATVDAMGLAPDVWKRLSARLIGPVEGGVSLADLWGAPVPAAAPRRGDEPLLITHTSSTTGISKLVENSVAGVTFSARIEATTPFGHSPRELAASCISFVHVRAAITIMATLARGTGLLAVGEPDDETVLRLFRRHRPTAVEAHPNLFVRWERLCGHRDEPLANIRVFFSTFDAVHPRTVTRLLDASRRTLPLWVQCYGQTEVQVVSVRVYTRGSARRLSERGTRFRSVGWPVPGVHVRVVDPHTGRRRRPGAAGLIQVRTPARALSFVGTPQKYWERRYGQWFDSGDWGRRGRLGDIEIFDRIADRIEGVESCLWVEDVLLQRLPDAEEIVIVRGGDGSPVPVVTMRDGKALDGAAWNAATRDMPYLAQPRELSATDLRRTATAKARRYLLSERIGSPGDAPDAPVASALLREGA